MKHDELGQACSLHDRAYRLVANDVPFACEVERQEELPRKDIGFAFLSLAGPVSLNALYSNGNIIFIRAWIDVRVVAGDCLSMQPKVRVFVRLVEES